jgi:hypothetical protein
VPPSVDPQTAAAEAIRLYDSDRDGRLSQTELKACPGIQTVRDRYDTDGDGQVTQEEVVARLEHLYSQSVGLLAVTCAVTHRGRPLAGAEVRFIPEPFLGDAVETAVAITDASGAAAPSIPADKLPPQLAKLWMMQVGIYRVEIEHPSLSAAERKPLGFEVDPTGRDGTTARFDL